MRESEGRSFSEIPGRREAFDRSHAEIGVLASVGQARFSATLDRIGPPGAARWDPIAGEVELRGRTFRAEQLGSFDGRSWLWSWANPHLEIPAREKILIRTVHRDIWIRPPIMVSDPSVPPTNN